MLRFVIRGSGGRPVTTYETSHDKDLHLIAVRRDLTGFQHVHPTLAADGTWTVPVALTPGQWRVFADLQPYLGAYGHLVALRAGDLAYLHVHPAGSRGDGTTAPGPDITFHTTTPSAGACRLFLDFQHEGKVRTAEFTVQVDGQGEPSAAATSTAPAVSPSTTPAAHAHGEGSRHG